MKREKEKGKNGKGRSRKQVLHLENKTRLYIWKCRSGKQKCYVWNVDVYWKYLAGGRFYAMPRPRRFDQEQ